MPRITQLQKRNLQKKSKKNKENQLKKSIKLKEKMAVIFFLNQRGFLLEKTITKQYKILKKALRLIKNIEPFQKKHLMLKEIAFYMKKSITIPMNWTLMKIFIKIQNTKDCIKNRKKQRD